MTTPSQTQIIEQTLHDVHSRIDGLDDLVVLHRDGTVLGRFQPADSSEQVTRAAPQLADLTDEICLALEQGVSTEAILKGTERFIAMYKSAEDNIFLTIIGKKGVNFGLLSSGCRRALGTIQKVFQE